MGGGRGGGGGGGGGRVKPVGGLILDGLLLAQLDNDSAIN